MVTFNFDLLDERNFSALYRFASIMHDNTVNQILLDLRSALIRELNFRFSAVGGPHPISMDLEDTSPETIAEAINAIGEAGVHFAKSGHVRAATFCVELVCAIKEDSQKIEESLTAKIQDMESRIRSKEKPAVSQLEVPGVTSNGNEVAQATVPRKFFDYMTVALTHVLGPMASIIIRDHVAALDESMETFPKARVIELIEIVSIEISDENLKIGFRKVLSEMTRE